MLTHTAGRCRLVMGIDGYKVVCLPKGCTHDWSSCPAVDELVGFPCHFHVSGCRRLTECGLMSQQLMQRFSRHCNLGQLYSSCCCAAAAADWCVGGTCMAMGLDMKQVKLMHRIMSNTSPKETDRCCVLMRAFWQVTRPVHLRLSLRQRG